MTARTIQAIEPHGQLRDQWLDHIFWVRSVVVSSNYGNAAEMEVAD